MATPRVVPNQRPADFASVEDVAHRPAPTEYCCDMCGETFAGRPEGAGLFLWHRGDELRFEEPPLCEHCAEQVTVGALVKWAWEDEAAE